jgi:hypothetical protein
LSSVNKVHHVHTIARVAEVLGEDEDWLWDVASEMDQEDGLIWVYGPGEESVMAFTDFGIETLTGIIEIYKANPDLLKRSTSSESPSLRPTPNAYDAPSFFSLSWSTSSMRTAASGRVRPYPSSRAGGTRRRSPGLSQRRR